MSGWANRIGDWLRSARAACGAQCGHWGTALSAGVVAVGGLTGALPSGGAQPGGPLLDDFHDLALWSAEASDDVKVTLRQTLETTGQALCIDFDFGQVSGYALARRSLALTYPDDYEFAFKIRGDAPVNSLQLKLLDASGDNVWWANLPDFQFPHDWQTLRFKKRQLVFAWGPTADRALRRSASLEFVIAAGKGGGKGSVCFQQLLLHALPAVAVSAAVPGRPIVSATSTQAPSQAAFALDGSATTAWRSDPDAGPEQTLTVDFGASREFGGLILHWLPGLHASRYAIELSDDARAWRVVRRVRVGNGGDDPILLPESEARYLRVHMLEGPAHAYALAELEMKDPAFGATPNAFIQALAASAPRGFYPRGMSGEQEYWTVVGIDGGPTQALFGEDGALEFSPGSPALEPMLLTDEGLVTWADVRCSQTLRDGYLPIPTVVWHKPGLDFRMTTFAMGDRMRSQIIAGYTVENHTARVRTVTLVLAVRPFQVNPPTQFLNIMGGYAPVRTLTWDGKALAINDSQRVFPLQPPTEVVMAPFAAGNLPQILAHGERPRARSLEDETGMASGALLYRLKVPPSGARTIDVVVPLTGEARLPATTFDPDTDLWVRTQERAVAARWRETLNRVQLRVPPAGQSVVDTLRSALAHTLINREGPALRPGTRSYARVWIRDGAMSSVALLRLAHEDVVREFIDWFAPHQFSNGKVPCCVDTRGSDPVPENDSHGEFLYAVGEFYRYTGDVRWVQGMWSRASRAAAYMEALRHSERGAKNATDLRRAYFGLMPPSISHEGYSDKPAYSYWDDFWTLAGYRSVSRIAQALGRTDDARMLASERDEFRADLLASIKATIAQHQINFIPGSADRGDFDATSTTVALSPGGEQADLPQEQLRATFERYWREFRARREGRDGELYTPYEMRVIGTFVRLGWRGRAAQLLDFFLADRRPIHWNQWGEIVRRDPRKAGFIGDMPHGWVASDYIRATLDLLAYEREEDQALVLAAGVPEAWMQGEGVELRALRTPYGPLSYHLHRVKSHFELTIPSTLAVPPGGLAVRLPPGADRGAVRVNGKPAQLEGEELRITQLPSRVVMAAK